MTQADLGTMALEYRTLHADSEQSHLTDLAKAKQECLNTDAKLTSIHEPMAEMSDGLRLHEHLLNRYAEYID